MNTVTEHMLNESLLFFPNETGNEFSKLSGLWWCPWR